MCGGSSESHPVLSEMLTDVIEAWGLLQPLPKGQVPVLIKSKTPFINCDYGKYPCVLFRWEPSAIFNGKLSFSKFSVIKGNLPSLPQAEYSEPCLTLPHSLKKKIKKSSFLLLCIFILMCAKWLSGISELSASGVKVQMYSLRGTAEHKKKRLSF